MIPVSEPLLGEEELELATRCIESGWVSSGGEFTKTFETEWARRCDRSHGIAVSNGTTALHLAVAALRPEPGAEIILPSFTIISCALAVVYNRCTPILVDVDPETWCMDIEQVAEKISERTAAVMPVHMYGHPVDMDPLLRIARERDVAIVEDAAEAHGAEYRSAASGDWSICGGFGTASTFSFYANKLVTTGEGGMVLTDDPELADRCRSLRDLAFEPHLPRFEHRHLGFNFRMTNLQAAIGVAQLQRFESVLQRKRRIGAMYRELLDDVEGVQFQAEREWARPVHWMVAITLRDEIPFDAAELATRLRDAGVETRPFFLGMHQQPVFREMGLFGDETYPVTERIRERGLYLPSGPTLTDAQVIEVCETLRKAIER